MMDHRLFAAALAFDPELTAGDVRCAVALLDYLEFENKLPVSMAQLARRLGVTRQSIQQHLTHLRKAGVILDDGPGPANQRLMRWSSAYIWKGSADDHRRQHRRDAQATKAKREARARRKRASFRAIEGKAPLPAE